VYFAAGQNSAGYLQFMTVSNKQLVAKRHQLRIRLVERANLILNLTKNNFTSNANLILLNKIKLDSSFT